MPNLLTKLHLEELSLVDRPANAQAMVSLFKRDNSEEEVNKMTEENPFYKMDLGYLSALMATVTGTDQQAKLAKEYLKDVDPDIWNE